MVFVLRRPAKGDWGRCANDRHLTCAHRIARTFGRGISAEVNEKFVKMYVNEDTLDMGEPGLKALHHLYARAQEKGLLDRIPEIDLV